MYKELKTKVFEANIALVRYGLVTLTWGNVSGVDRRNRCIAIKPSGVDYATMTPEDIVIVDMEGNIVDGNLRPSSDTPAHLELYKAFPTIGGVAHTHSLYATMFAQAYRDIPCFGTTHADHFAGPVPATRLLTKLEVQDEYERATGKIIVERFAELDPESTPGVLVSGHAPFAWGTDAGDAVKNSLVLERVAQMAIGSLQLNPQLAALPSFIQEKHYKRKHGPEASYGQVK